VIYLGFIKTQPVWNWKYSRNGHETAAKTAKRCFVNALFIHTVLFDHGLFSSYMYIKHNWLTQPCNTKFFLLCKSAILLRILRCDTAYQKHCHTLLSTLLFTALLIRNAAFVEAVIN